MFKIISDFAPYVLFFGLVFSIAWLILRKQSSDSSESMEEELHDEGRPVI